MLVSTAEHPVVPVVSPSGRACHVQLQPAGVMWPTTSMDANSIGKKSSVAEAMFA